MNAISIDLETFSSIDLKKCGVYKYCESADFCILLFGYSVDGGEVNVVDLAMGENIPDEIIAALTDNTVTKWAYNANFERIALSRHLGLICGQYLDPTAWKCSQVWGAYLGLPLSLEKIGEVLGLEKQKLKEGSNLIDFFCKPCKPTRNNGGKTRNLPEHAPDKWEQFKDYNVRDVETEMLIQKKLEKFPVPEEIWEEYHLDQEINDRGIGLDLRLAQAAIELDSISHAALEEEVQKQTGILNPNSVSQLKAWLSENEYELETLGKKSVAAALISAPQEIRSVLELRLQLAKSSVKKYAAMENSVCGDMRIRGMFKFYGANRSGRFAGRNVQLQNLPQNHMPDLKTAREIVISKDKELLEMLYGDVPDTLSQLIRTAFVPQNGRKFIVADFSAIEARVLSWISDEEWRTEVFRNNGDIYCASASQMFGVPVEKHGQNAHLRQKGKIAELALGYGGSVGALKQMGALDMGLSEYELQPLVNAWRTANPNIVSFWWDVDKAVTATVREKKPSFTHGIKFTYESGFLFIVLPSGRRLAYVRPRITTNDYGRPSVSYEGIGKNKKWQRIDSYGPKFTENIIQAISRDILLFAMKNLRKFNITAHVHDEVIIEAPSEIQVQTICDIMGLTPPWAEGLLLRAEGYECEFYKKD
ncbi:MAG: DNA polymerase [Oscillospiraceae bacterium]|nr:DNA polymerase [Oscillospiraceae bacterium]